jgi:hypothetical protein
LRIQLETFQFEIELVRHELAHSLGVDPVEFGDEAGRDQAVLESQPDFLSGGEDQLVQVVEYKFERLWVVLVDLNDLTYAAGVEGLVLDVTEVTEDLLYLLLH